MPANIVCEGYVFTCVCHSVHRGGLPHSMLGYHTPLPLAWRHPRAVHAGRYGQQAGGMHPTGMQSCRLKISILLVFQGIGKHAIELYGLINYAEMRKKIGPSKL